MGADMVGMEWKIETDFKSWLDRQHPAEIKLRPHTTKSMSIVATLGTPPENSDGRGGIVLPESELVAHCDRAFLSPTGTRS